MRSVLVTAPDDTLWTVRVVWEPRWRALVRRFGGWRRQQKNRDGDSGDVVDAAVQIGDAATPGSGGGRAGGFDLGDPIIVLMVVFRAVIAATRCSGGCCFRCF